MSGGFGGGGYGGMQPPRMMQSRQQFGGPRSQSYGMIQAPAQVAPTQYSAGGGDPYSKIGQVNPDGTVSAAGQPFNPGDMFSMQMRNVGSYGIPPQAQAAPQMPTQDPNSGTGGGDPRDAFRAANPQASAPAYNQVQMGNSLPPMGGPFGWRGNDGYGFGRSASVFGQPTGMRQGPMVPLGSGNVTSGNSGENPLYQQILNGRFGPGFNFWNRG